MRIKKRIFEIVEKSQRWDKASALFDYFLIILISLNVIAVIVGSFNFDHYRLNKALTVFEIISIIIFTLEYLLRVWTAPIKYPPPSKKSLFLIPYLKYIFSFMALIDLCAILPFYLPFIVNLDLRALRVLRLFRLLRILKMNRYNKSLDLMGRVLKNEKEKLLMAIFITGTLLLLASSVMYYFENTAQPDKFPNIPATLWWAVATLTTVGYGDVYPITIPGKILSGIIALLGIGLVALPSGIISSGLINEVKDEKKGKQVCPHCGKEI